MTLELDVNEINFILQTLGQLPSSSGYTIGPFILIRPRCKGDAGLLEHEKVAAEKAAFDKAVADAVAAQLAPVEVAA